MLSLVVAAVLAPAALVAYATPNATPKPTSGIPGLPGAVGLEEVKNVRSLPW